METAIDGFQGRRGQLDDPDRVLATAKHYAGDGDTEYGTPTGDYKVDQGIAVTSRPDFWKHSLRQYVPAVQQARRRQRDAVVLERRLDRGRRRQPAQDARAPGADHRRAEGPDGLRRLRDQRLGGDPPDPAGRPGRRGPTEVRESVNAGVDMFMEPNQDVTPRRPALATFQSTLAAEVDAGRRLR